MKHEQLIKYVEIAAIVLLLFGLGGWYLFLRNQSSSIEDTANARGFSIGIPAFLGARGSTAANIESGLTGGPNGAAVFSDELGMGGQKIDGTDVSGGAGAAKPRAPRLFRVSTIPVAGATFITTTQAILRYVERSTGHLFDVNPETGEIQRVTNTLLPKTYEALIGPKDTVLVQNLDAPEWVRTRAGKIGTTTENGTLPLTTREISIPLGALAVSRTTSDILLLATTETGLQIIQSAWDGNSPKPVANFPGGEFKILWPSEKRIILIEKPASGIMGHAYSITPERSPLARGVGLMYLPHENSNAALWSTDTGSSVTLSAIRPNGTTVPIPLQTVADKCVWAPGAELSAYCAVPNTPLQNSFVDRWLSGETHTDDTLYSVNVAAGTSEKVYSFEGTAIIDVEEPRIDSTGTYLSFINARDKSLWLLRIQDQ